MATPSEPLPEMRFRADTAVPEPRELELAPSVRATPSCPLPMAEVPLLPTPTRQLLTVVLRLERTQIPLSVLPEMTTSPPTLSSPTRVRLVERTYTPCCPLGTAALPAGLVPM